MLTTNRKQAPNHDDKTLVHDTLARASHLRVDFARLNDDEARELVQLTKAATAEGRLDLAQLGKKRERWEQLVEKAAARPGAFKAERDAAELDAKMSELRRRAVRRPFTRAQEHSIFAAIAEQLHGGFLHAEHVGVLALVLCALESGRPVNPAGGRVEQGVLVVDRRLGLAGADRDPDARLRWQEALGQLERNSWLSVTRNGNELRVALGTRAIRALGQAR